MFPHQNDTTDVLIAFITFDNENWIEIQRKYMKSNYMYYTTQGGCGTLFLRQEEP